MLRKFLPPARVCPHSSGQQETPEQYKRAWNPQEIRWNTRLCPAENISRNCDGSISRATRVGPGCPAVEKHGGRNSVCRAEPSSTIKPLDATAWLHTPQSCLATS